MVESTILPGMEEAHEALLEVFEEMEGQLDKEVARLRALKQLRLDDPGDLIRLGILNVADGRHFLHCRSRSRS